MKNKILIPLIAFITLTSCLNIDKDGCPEDMYLTFDVDDPYEPSTYDARIANDLMLYVFKDKRVVSATLISYEEIKGGQPHVIRKNVDISGNLDIVAWAVPFGQDKSSIPQLSIGDNLTSIYRSLSPLTRSEEYSPTSLELLVGRKSIVEAIDKITMYELGMNYTDCRMEVRVTDNNHVLSQPGSNPKVSVNGTMSSVDLNGNGVGSPATINVGLNSPSNDNVAYTTGRFGVLPSADGQTVSVIISDGTKMIATLTVPPSVLPQGATPGGLITFEYTLGTPEFTIIVEGFRQKVVITNM